VQIAFDRLLAPGSITRQSFYMHDAEGNQVEPTMLYDPATRVVTLSSPQSSSNPTWLTPGTVYTVEMGVAKASDRTGLSGVKAIDGATLAARVTEQFIAGPAAATPSEDRPIDFCEDVLPVLVNSCSGGPCHGSPGQGTEPREGLILDAPLGILNTAVGQESHESNMGGLAGITSPSAPPFGVDMPIIAVNQPGVLGSPGDSWLMYKILLAAGGAPTTPVKDVPKCTLASPLPSPVGQPTAQNPAVTTVPLSDSERATLATYVYGQQMPYPDVPPLDDDAVQRLRAWITQGAVVTDCPGCD
jgi:hypothetical protein